MKKRVGNFSACLVVTILITRHCVCVCSKKIKCDNCENYCWVWVENCFICWIFNQLKIVQVVTFFAALSSCGCRDNLNYSKFVACKNWIFFCRRCSWSLLQYFSSADRLECISHNNWTSSSAKMFDFPWQL